MKHIIYPLMAFFIMSCSSYKPQINEANDDDNPKYILIFLNNTSKEKISKKNREIFLNTDGLFNNKKYIFHSERQENVDYEYGLEILINEISIVDSPLAPRYYKKAYAIYENRRDFDLATRPTKVVNGQSASIDPSPKEVEIKEFRAYKNCLIKGEFIFLNLNTGDKIKNKTLKASNNFIKIYTEDPNTNRIVDVIDVENNNMDLNNIGIMRNNPAFNNGYYSNNPSFVIDTDLKVLLPSDEVFSTEVFKKLRSDLEKFTNKI